MDKRTLPPVIFKRDSLSRVQAEELARITVRQKRISAFIGAFAALLAHLALLAVFAVVVLGVIKSEKIPARIVVTDPDWDLEEVNEQVVYERLTERPSPGSMKAVNTIAAVAPVAAVTTPIVDVPPDRADDFGSATGLSDRFGFKNLGNGFGRSTFMGIKGNGKNIILVIDTSTSMPRNCGAQGISAIRREIIGTINGFAGGTRFNIICFAKSADAFQEESVPATSKNKAAAIRFMRAYYEGDESALDGTRTESISEDLEGVQVSGAISWIPIHPTNVQGLEGTRGGSRIDLGMVAAMERKPSTIFVLSDGEPIATRDDSILSHAELVDIVDKNYRRIYRGKELIVNTLSIRDLGEKFLTTMSSRFDGEHRRIDPDKLQR